MVSQNTQATKKVAARAASNDEFTNFITEFKNESDRAAVILGAAKLDLLLFQIIQQFLLPMTGTKDELLDGDSALGTFSAKIHLVNRLGLIDAEFTRALHFIRKIRNSFAHEVSGCTLSSGGHSDRVKELVAQMKHTNAFIDAREKFFGGKDEAPANFRTGLAFLVARLEFLLNHIVTIDSSVAISIYSPAHIAKGEVNNPLKKNGSRK
jgi:hypothetical protein